MLKKVKQCLQNENTNATSTRVMNRIVSHSKQYPGNLYSREHLRQALQAACMPNGTPTFFITLNPVVIH